ncbi:MAG: hypothetical protein GX457_14245, partial [Thermotogaceae bacterium]|nr:hypothetical protein [Thermotogaceae bacterium]
MNFGLDLVTDLLNLVQNLFKSLKRNLAPCSNAGLESLIDGSVHNLDDSRVVVDASQLRIGQG